MAYKSKAQKIAERSAADSKRLLTKDWDGNKIWEYNISKADSLGFDIETAERGKYRAIFKDSDQAGAKELRAFYIELAPISAERERFISFLRGVTTDGKRSEPIQAEAGSILRMIEDKQPPYNIPTP